jgi:signal peptidase I
MQKCRSNRNLARAIIAAIAVTLVIKVFVLDFMIADGYSMAPAIRPGSIIVVCRIFYGIKLPGSSSYLVRWRDPREGDVLVFHTPPGEVAVKRCVQIFPGGRFYARGDNAFHSYDSRNYGAVEFDKILGRVLGVR